MEVIIKYKEMEKSNLYRIAILLVIISCNPGVYHERLSEGYYYSEPGIGNNYINKNTGVPKKTDALSYIHLAKQNIYPKVTHYQYNRDFIVAAQKPNKKGHSYLLGFDLEFYFHEKHGVKEDRSEKEIYTLHEEKGKVMADSLLRNDPYYKNIFLRNVNYWIISHKLDSLYGPLTKEEYIEKYKKLEMPKKFEFSRVFKGLE